MRRSPASETVDRLRQGSAAQSSNAAVHELEIRKLAPYKRHGYRTVLLIESSDINLMNTATLLGALERAYGGLPPDIDEVWFADTALPDQVLFENFTRFPET